MSWPISKCHVFRIIKIGIESTFPKKSPMYSMSYIHLSKNKELTHKSMTRDGRKHFLGTQKERKSVYNNNNYISYFLFGMCYWSLDRKYPIKVISFFAFLLFLKAVSVYLAESFRVFLIRFETLIVKILIRPLVQKNTYF